MSGLPHFIENRLTVAARLSTLRATRPLRPGIFLLIIFLKAESTPGPQCSWKIFWSKERIIEPFITEISTASLKSRKMVKYSSQDLVLREP
jgi:hypothetical protein